MKIYKKVEIYPERLHLKYTHPFNIICKTRQNNKTKQQTIQLLE